MAATWSGTTEPRTQNVYFDPAVQPKHVRDCAYQMYLYLSARLKCENRFCFINAVITCVSTVTVNRLNYCLVMVHTVNNKTITILLIIAVTFIY